MQQPAQNNSVERLLALVRLRLLDCFQTTGFGAITIRSERIQNGKIRVIVEAGTHTRFVIDEQDILNA